MGRYLNAAALAAGILLLATGAVRGADGDKPRDEPWTLDANNWQEGKDLLPEPVVKRLQKGEYWFKVVPVDPAKFKQNYSQAFWAATAASMARFTSMAFERVRRPRISVGRAGLMFGAHWPELPCFH